LSSGEKATFSQIANWNLQLILFWQFHLPELEGFLTTGSMPPPARGQPQLHPCFPGSLAHPAVIRFLGANFPPFGMGDPGP
jgi:hypothetical protein